MAVTTIWWLIVGCRLEIAWLIVDGMVAVAILFFLRVLFSVLLSQMTSFDRAL